MDEFVSIYIAEWRQESGLSPEELAELLDISPAQLQALEKGKADYTPQTIYRLSRIFDIDAYRLFTHPAVKFERDGLREAMTTEAMAALLRIYLPDVLSSLKDKGRLNQLLDDSLPEEYWLVQAEKMLELVEFLKSYKKDPTATLRSLFETLETQPPSPDTSC